AKYNFSSPEELECIARYQYEQLEEVEALLKEQMLDLEKQLYPDLIPNDDIQRLLWIPGVGKRNAFNILLEVNDINRLADVKNFFSYCRLVPSSRNSACKSKQRPSKDGNKYLKRVFTDAAIHAIQYYPVIRKYHNSLLRKKNKFVARTIIAKELARVVFYTMKYEKDYNNKFKGKELQHTTSVQWPRITSPDV
ncbi:transposase, partial [Bacteroidota bacterium]